MRGLGFTETLSNLPEPFVAAFALVTQLGDVWFLFATLGLLYLLAGERIARHPRRTGALLVALSVGALATTLALKAAFGFSRPPDAGTASIPPWLPPMLETVYLNAATGDGLGFPSGHAIGTTVAYGGAAAVLDVWNRRKRTLVAGTLVGLVCLARLVLGVHYLVDVVAGVAVGLAYLAVALRVADGDPARAFGVAAVAAAAGLAVVVFRGVPSELGPMATALGAGIAGGVVWQRLDASQLSNPVSVPVAVVGIALSGLPWVSAYLVEPGPVVSLVAGATGLSILVALPALSGRLGGEKSGGETSRAA
ncbi:phosphatase PAP2 family protein [Haloprofundus halophilus]|uniref:phosphatase PAP2 family protein n=1 Tax=Haloprofundus halophilus TaxID=2283527 RepID=UPI000E436168|nr:phosphatase PAP2 family protein [Haloprofundus halophilus]